MHQFGPWQGAYIEPKQQKETARFPAYGTETDSHPPPAGPAEEQKSNKNEKMKKAVHSVKK